MSIIIRFVEKVNQCNLRNFQGYLDYIIIDIYTIIPLEFYMSNKDRSYEKDIETVCARSGNDERLTNVDVALAQAVESARAMYQYMYDQEDRDIEKAINALRNFAF